MKKIFVRISTILLLSPLALEASAIYPEGYLQSENFEGQLQQINFSPTWEKKPEARAWSEFLYDLIDRELFVDLDKVTDMTRFCPTYKKLDREHKIYAWLELVSQMTYYESGWSPVSRMQEDMGTDPVTKKPVFSEGLMQLSYQDTVNYPKLLKYPDCKIDWSKDKDLAVKDPNKTILNPYINLECGSRILADQIKRKRKIAMSSGVYWAVLRDNPYQFWKAKVVDQIAAGVKKVSFCR